VDLFVTNALQVLELEVNVLAARVDEARDLPLLKGTAAGACLKQTPSEGAVGRVRAN